MNTPYIHAAICSNGKLRITQMMPGKCILSAHISFPDGSVVKGEISMSVSGAIEKLEARLKALNEVQS